MAGSDFSQLYRWSNGTIVIFAERDGSEWAISRGWRTGDRLDDVRRWRFESERRLVGQLRRLVREATDDHLAANAAVSELEIWIQGSPENPQ